MVALLVDIWGIVWVGLAGYKKLGVILVFGVLGEALKQRCGVCCAATTHCCTGRTLLCPLAHLPFPPRCLSCCPPARQPASCCSGSRGGHACGAAVF